MTSRIRTSLVVGRVECSSILRPVRRHYPRMKGSESPSGGLASGDSPAEFTILRIVLHGSLTRDRRALGLATPRSEPVQRLERRRGRSRRAATGRTSGLRTSSTPDQRARRCRTDSGLAGSSFPADLLDRQAAIKEASDRGYARLEQLAFADFVSRGE